MTKTIKTRYVLIIKLLINFKLTFKQLREKLLESHDFISNNLKSYSLRTFQRDIKDIEMVYGIQIKSLFDNAGRYQIVNMNERCICEKCLGTGYVDLNKFKVRDKVLAFIKSKSSYHEVEILRIQGHEFYVYSKDFRENYLVNTVHKLP